MQHRFKCKMQQKKNVLKINIPSFRNNILLPDELLYVFACRDFFFANFLQNRLIKSTIGCIVRKFILFTGNRELQIKAETLFPD